MKDRRCGDIEVRASKNDDKMILEGYAVVFDQPATYYGETEIIDKKAFDGCDMKDVVLRYNHTDTFNVLARTRNKSLSLEVDDKGVKFKAELIDTSTNKDLYKMVKNGLVDKCSFAFADWDCDYDEDTRTTTIKKIDKLFDVSLVDFPYYDGTSVFARNLDTREELIKQHNAMRRKALINRLKKEELLKRLETK